MWGVIADHYRNLEMLGLAVITMAMQPPNSSLGSALVCIMFACRNIFIFLDGRTCQRQSDLQLLQKLQKPGPTTEGC